MVSCALSRKPNFLRSSENRAMHTKSILVTTAHPRYRHFAAQRTRERNVGVSFARLSFSLCVAPRDYTA